MSTTIQREVLRTLFVLACLQSGAECASSKETKQFALYESKAAQGAVRLAFKDGSGRSVSVDSSCLLLVDAKGVRSQIGRASSPLEVSLDPGHYWVIATAPGFRRQCLEFDVVAGESVDLSAILEAVPLELKAPAPYAQLRPYDNGPKPGRFSLKIADQDSAVGIADVSVSAWHGVDCLLSSILPTGEASIEIWNAPECTVRISAFGYAPRVMEISELHRALSPIDVRLSVVRGAFVKILPSDGFDLKYAGCESGSEENARLGHPLWSCSQVAPGLFWIPGGIGKPQVVRAWAWRGVAVQPWTSDFVMIDDTANTEEAALQLQLQRAAPLVVHFLKKEGLMTLKFVNESGYVALEERNMADHPWRVMLLPGSYRIYVPGSSDPVAFATLSSEGTHISIFS